MPVLGKVKRSFACVNINEGSKLIVKSCNLEIRETKREVTVLIF